jgi:hypothetical protein
VNVTVRSLQFARAVLNDCAVEHTMVRQAVSEMAEPDVRIGLCTRHNGLNVHTRDGPEPKSSEPEELDRVVPADGGDG